MRSVRSSIRITMLSAVCALMLAACGGQVTQPKDYGEINSKGEGFYGNLMYGCTGVTPNDDGKYTNTELGDANYCQCLYRGLEQTVPFDDAKKFDEAQAKEDAGEITVPKNIAAVQTKCNEDTDSYS
ncbi:hypothetical protein BH10ACT3_BH10ACT3_15340 [soil metagenome]